MSTQIVAAPISAFSQVDMPIVWWLNGVRMKSKVVAILETRTGAHLAEMVERRGGVPLLAPALQEVPDIDAEALQALLRQWRADPFEICIFQTGVGTKALFTAADAAGMSADLKELLAASRVAVRGPKPSGELNSRGIRIDIRAGAPFTTETVLAALAAEQVAGASILVQRHGEKNRALCEGLEARGAQVQEIATYRWALPTDTRPLSRLLDALSRGQVDAVVFTSAVQVHNLYSIAQEAGSAAELANNLNRSVVASIGPVCSRALRDHGVTPSFEANPPKLGPLLSALDAALGG
jgi:uroporphyrinogen-III synthase